MRASVALALLLVAAGVQAQGALPRLDGVVLWDTPIGQAPADVQAAWRDASAMITHRCPPPRARTTAAMQAWTTDIFGPWLTERRDAIAALDTRLLALASTGPREMVFGSALHALLLRDIVDQVTTMPIPTDIAADPGLVDIYRHARDGAVVSLMDDAEEAFRTCAASAPQAPPSMQPDAERCATLATDLERRRAAAE
jgi:hypothetical protein